MDERLNKCINWIQFDELMSGESNCPHKILGQHIYDGHQVITVYNPSAESVKVKDEKGNKKKKLEKIDDRGFFAIYLEDKVYNGDKYVLETKYLDGNTKTNRDPFAFEPIISDMDMYLFAEGNHYDIYKKLGAHVMKINGVEGTHFAVWAPNARRVSVVGDFNNWMDNIHTMSVIGSSGIHEIFIPGVKEGAIYKFLIRTREGKLLYKTDPYGNQAELRPNNASVVANLNGYKWKDSKWMNARKSRSRDDLKRQPMNIYEVHLGSWRKDDVDEGFRNYKDIAHELADYVLDMGYTHIELMGIAEYPFDGSWGYQVTGYYAPTSRYGSPKDFMYFIDYMHKKGISVILDWVPAHFPKDANALGRFDGEPLYEHPDTRKGEHPHWGTYIFNYEKNEVANFLIANALFWLEEFHVDGLRVDAVASMLYLDYGKNDGEWVPNKYGGKENLVAVEFFRHLNSIIDERVPGSIMIAEESTCWPKVTTPINEGGLGFLFKWNMGWMNDFLEYMKTDPLFRKGNHNKLTFSMMYAYSENFIQVISHDEVVHEKCSMLNKMPGYEIDKFANLKAGYGFMYAHPGKKLLFMGQEFAQKREWSEERSLDWYELDNERNRQMQNYMRDLNTIYKKYDAFYTNDTEPIGFEWLDCDNASQSIVSFVRRGKNEKDQLLFVYNFTPIWRDEYIIGVPCGGKYTQILNSDDTKYGGYGAVYEEPIIANKGYYNKRNYYITFKIPPLSCMIFKFDYLDDNELEKQSNKSKKRKTSTTNKSSVSKTRKTSSTSRKKTSRKKSK